MKPDSEKNFNTLHVGHRSHCMYINGYDYEYEICYYVGGGAE